MSAMKKSFVVLFLFFTSFSFAQQLSKSGLNTKKSTDDLLLPNGQKLPLNMDFFKLKESKPNINALSELRRKLSKQKAKANHNMPIFVPEGKFFLEIYDVEEDVDYKLRIFELQKSNYSLRSAG